MTKFGAQTKMYQAAWLQAFDLGERRLTFPTRAERDRARFALYNCVRKKEELPVDLAEAYEACNLVLVDDLTILLRRFDRDPALMNIAAQLGIVGNPGAGLGTTIAKTAQPVSVDELDASMDALSERLASDAPAPNPFYTRE